MKKKQISKKRFMEILSELNFGFGPDLNRTMFELMIRYKEMYEDTNNKLDHYKESAILIYNELEKIGYFK